MLILARADARALPLADGCVQCCVCSPPYWGLRDYGAHGQLGLEATPDGYVAHMVEVFREVRRVLRDDGTLWLNLGDSHASTASGAISSSGLEGSQSSQIAFRKSTQYKSVPPGLKPKDLVGIPWRVAFALQADGWWLRSCAPWLKRSAMPESVTDRPSTALEYVFLLSKSETYFYDAEAVKMPAVCGDHPRTVFNNTPPPPPGMPPHTGIRRGPGPEAGRNRRNTDWFFESWKGLLTDDDGDSLAFVVNPTPYKGAHYAAFPPRLVEPCVLASSSAKGSCVACGAPWERVVDRTFVPQQDVSEAKGVRGAGEQKPMDESNGWQGVPRGTTNTRTTGWRPSCSCGTADVRPCVVLDPFAGTGTVGVVALRHGRRAVCADLSQTYLRDLATKRTSNVQMDLLSAMGAA